MLGSPRVYVALAKDGLFPGAPRRDCIPGSARPPLRSPCRPAWPRFLVVVGTFADIVVYFVCVTVVFIAMSVAALYRLPEAGPEGFKTPLRRVTPAVFVGLCALLLVLLLLGESRCRRFSASRSWPSVFRSTRSCAEPVS